MSEYWGQRGNLTCFQKYLKQKILHTGSRIITALYFSTATLAARRQWNNALKILKEIFPIFSLYTAKWLSVDRINTFPDMQEAIWGKCKSQSQWDTT